MIAGLGLIYIVTYYVDYFKNQPKKDTKTECETDVKIIKKTKRNHIKTCIFSTIFSLLWITGVVVSSNASPIFWGDKTIVVEADSMYNYLKVSREGKKMLFSTNVLFGVQSCMNDDYSLTGMYYDALLVSPYLVKENPKVLVLGNGTGTYATMMKDYLHCDCEITAVEIDQKIIDLSYKYFKMNKDVNVVCDDGRNFIARDKNTYDIILVDAYSSISAPFHMTTVEFFNSVREHLSDDGLMMMNINMRSNIKGSINEVLCDTANSVFGNLYTWSALSGMEVFATKNQQRDLIEDIKKISVDNHELQSVFNSLKNNLKKHADTGLRLYDDTADVEMRSIQTLDVIVQEEVNYYKDIYKKEGLDGLLKRLLG